MKFLYCLCAAALLGTFASSANAVRLQILDPSTFPGDGSVTATSISGPFSATFGQMIGLTLTSNCPLAEGPYDDGTFCFDGINGTGAPITSMEFTVSDALLGIQPATCDDNAFGNDQFGTASCSAPTPSDEDYTWLFTGGTPIPKNGLFVIAETGADPADFAGNTVTPNPTLTPEPASIVMLSSAAAMLGLLLFARRRSLHDSLL